MDESRDFVLKLVNIIKFTVIDIMLEVSPQKELQRVKLAGNVRPRHDVMTVSQRPGKLRSRFIGNMWSCTIFLKPLIVEINSLLMPD